MDGQMAYRHYEDQGYADSDDRQNWEHMYLQYHALGGNRTIDNLRQRLLEMPLKPASGSGYGSGHGCERCSCRE